MTTPDLSTREGRDQLRALAAAATPGPWVSGEPSAWGDNDDVPQSDIDTPAGALTWDDHGGEVFKPADAEFIAASRTAVPALLDYVEQLENALAGSPSKGARVASLVRSATHLVQVERNDAIARAVLPVVKTARRDARAKAIEEHKRSQPAVHIEPAPPREIPVRLPCPRCGAR